MFTLIINKLVNSRPSEMGALLMSWLYFYLLLCAYYIIRPIRNEMMIQNGVDNIQWLLLLTLVAMLAIAPVFGWLTSRFKTRQFLSYCTLFFATNLVGFFFLFNQPERTIGVTRGFYVWVSVFNMFIVSLFWSFMNDIFSQAQSKRLFAFIAAGGTAGALTGPAITTLLVERSGLSMLLLISAIILSLTTLCIFSLLRWNNPDAALRGHAHDKEEPLKGGVLDGVTLIMGSPYLLGVCAFIVLFTLLATFLSIQQAELIEHMFTEPAQRTKLFSQVDLATNVLTLLFQLFLTSRLINNFGFRNTLLIMPVGLTLGFAVIAAAPLLSVMVGLQIFRRAGDYAILKPAREMLFTILGREEKYKAKNFIDTAILRSGDTLSAWLYSGLKAIGAGSYGIALIGIGLGVLWSGVAFWLGNRYQQKTTHTLDPVSK